MEDEEAADDQNMLHLRGRVRQEPRGCKGALGGVDPSHEGAGGGFCFS